ncbi:MAG TPA: prepilin-type N-terminal cleavage/methylation domain-containing protein [Candidatus Ozemobacteraceae bacterium]|nr:prepilin-type N-terminal cleavage/methylation domain-containing protein [Candidatus Ozemobacteraceae bacterium]
MSRVGFTLIELIVVVAVIAVLSVTAYSYYQDSIETARFNVVRQNRALVQDALGRYFQSNLSYPVDLRALTPTYLTKYVDALLVEPLGNATIEVEIPGTIPVGIDPSDVNPLQATGAFVWVTDAVNQAYGGKQRRQIRAVRVRAANGILVE